MIQNKDDIQKAIEILDLFADELIERVEELEDKINDLEEVIEKLKKK